MLKEDAIEEAQELASVEHEQADDPTQIALCRVARRAEARTNTNRSFASLFDGAQIQTGDAGSGTRIFLNPEEGIRITSVMFDGVEMINELEENSLLLPAKSNGPLVIRTDYEETNPGLGIEIVSFDNVCVTVEGCLIKVSGLPDGCKVKLCGLDGVIYYSTISNGVELEMRVKSGRCYVLKAGKFSMKVMTR